MKSRMGSANPNYNLILNEFSPVKRKPLLRWLSESSITERVCHPAYQNLLQSLSPKLYYTAVDRQTKIAYSVLREFGPGLRHKSAYSYIVRAVEARIVK